MKLAACLLLASAPFRLSAEEPPAKAPAEPSPFLTGERAEFPLLGATEAGLAARYERIAIGDPQSLLRPPAQLVRAFQGEGYLMIVQFYQDRAALITFEQQGPDISPARMKQILAQCGGHWTAKGQGFERTDGAQAEPAGVTFVVTSAEMLKAISAHEAAKKAQSR